MHTKYNVHRRKEEIPSVHPLGDIVLYNISEQEAGDTYVQ